MSVINAITIPVDTLNAVNEVIRCAGAFVSSSRFEKDVKIQSDLKDALQSLYEIVDYHDKRLVG